MGRLGNYIFRLKTLYIIAFVFFISLSGAGIYFFSKTNIFINKKNDLLNTYKQKKEFLFLASGLKLKQVVIAGRDRTSEKDIAKIVSALPNMDITKLQIYQIRDELKKLPWVKDIEIRRILPNHLVIEIKERTPIAVYKHNNKFNPIDSDGNVIEITLNKPSGLPIITGIDSPEKVPFLLQSLKQESDLFRRVKGASWIGKRRWDIYLDDLNNGIVVKLPQKNFSSQWSHLSRINKEQQILDKDIHSIDLRDPEKSMINMDLKKNKTKNVKDEQEI